MRCNPWRWLWGLIPIVGLAWVAVQVEHARIERDLALRGKQELGRLGLDWADLSFSGRDGTLSGQAVDDSESTRAVTTALQTWGVRNIADRSGLIDKVDRYEWTALRRDNRVRLTGLVPTESTRREVIGIVKASFPNLEIEDRLRLARGAPPTDTWLGGVGFAIKQLAHLKNGQADLEVTSLSIVGEAIDAEAYRAVKAALARGMPPGIRLKLERVSAPVVKPYVWSAKLARDRLVLSGYAASEGARDDILAAARSGGTRGRVDDEMHIAGGAPEGWAEAAVAAVRGLATLEEGSAEMRDGVLSLAGVAENSAKADAVRALLRQVPAAIKVNEQLQAREPAIPTVSPYTTQVVLEGGVLQLGGNVPDEETRQWLLKRGRERLPGTEVRDGLQLGLGQPAGWQTCVDAALAGLGRAGNGTAHLVGGRLEVTVSTLSHDLAQAFASEIRNSVAGKCEADVRVLLLERPEPAFQWAANHNGKELVFSGHFAGTEAREHLLRAAQQLFPHAQLHDRAVVAEQKSEKWTRAAHQALSLLSRLRRGEVMLAERQVTLSGDVTDATVQSAVREALAKDLPDSYRGREMITVRSDPDAAAQQATAAILPKPSAQETEQKTQADKCQSLLQTVVRTGTIHFDRDSAELTPESMPTLRRLVDVINGCPSVRLEVAGHTDTDGRPEHNQLLSERRAHSIVEFLTNAGVGAERMRAAGYGESRPAVGNETPREKAQNRRIEFTVKTD